MSYRNSLIQKHGDKFVSAATPNHIEQTTFCRGVRITVAGSCEADCDARIKRIIKTYKAEFPHSVRDFKPGQRVQVTDDCAMYTGRRVIVERVGSKYVYARVPRSRRTTAIGYLPGQLVRA